MPSTIERAPHLVSTEATSVEPDRRASARSLVLHAVSGWSGTGDLSAFLLRRARREVDALEKGAERSILRRIVALLDQEGVTGTSVAACLVQLACELERSRKLPEADLAIRRAREIDPASAEIALHAGRLARKLGERERALGLYRLARSLDGEGALARLAAIGEAVVGEDPAIRISRVIRSALSAGDSEAAAVGLEERARLRRAAGDRVGAARDLCLAAARFTDAVDRARVAHALADVTIASADPFATREALLVALCFGDAPQREHARARLHTLCRDMGDQLGTRRWRSSERPALASLSLYRGRPAARSAAPRLAAWRSALERHALPTG